MGCFNYIVLDWSQSGRLILKALYLQFFMQTFCNLSFLMHDTWPMHLKYYPNNSRLNLRKLQQNISKQLSQIKITLIIYRWFSIFLFFILKWLYYDLLNCSPVQSARPKLLFYYLSIVITLELNVLIKFCPKIISLSICNFYLIFYQNKNLYLTEF